MCHSIWQGCAVKHIEQFSCNEEFERPGRPDHGNLGLLSWKEGMHITHRLPNGRWRCCICLCIRSKSFNGPGCRTDALKLGHCLWQVGNGVCCMKCGAYSFAKIGLLARHCPSKPVSCHLSRSLARLKQGTHPVSGTAIGRPSALWALIEELPPIMQGLSLELGNVP